MQPPTKQANRFSAWFPVVGLALAFATQNAFADEESRIEEVLVNATSIDQDALGAAATHLIAEEQIKLTHAFHPNEVFAEVPGVWITRNSGQEHLVAIRSGVLTGAGACGSYLLMENGIPVRPSGFCNVNGLMEVNLEQATSIETLRGPASAKFGGNALYGLINARTIDPVDEQSLRWTVGPNSWHKIELASQLGEATFRGHATSTDGWRDDTGLDQYKATTSLSQEFGPWSATHFVSLSQLQQETGGYVRGYRAYADSELRRSNPNPEAYRDADSIRASSHWLREVGDRSISISPYVRRSKMEFLQHFLPGQPTESNSQTSGGLIVEYGRPTHHTDLNLGLQVEVMTASLSQTQVNPTVGSAFLVATRPVGTHYNYDVNSTTVAAFYDFVWRASDRLEVQNLARLETLRYSYDNLHLDGNKRDDGSSCGFGGCLYSRPADRDDSFTNIAFNVGLEYRLSQSSTNLSQRLYALAASGFRAPQSTELYRLQSGQDVAHLDSEELRSLELGWRAELEEWNFRFAAYVQKATNLVLRDAEGFNISAGSMAGQGLELDVEWQPSDSQSFSLAMSIADHTYDFTRTIARGEQVNKGDTVDSAPRVVGSLAWTITPNDRFVSQFRLVHVGSHPLNIENTAHYGGHSVVHWYGNWQIASDWQINAKLDNLTGKRYADRADFAFGSYRYFPAPPRYLYLGVSYSF